MHKVLLRLLVQKGALGKSHPGGLSGQQLIHLKLLSDKCCSPGKYRIHNRAFVESPSAQHTVQTTVIIDATWTLENP